LTISFKTYVGQRGKDHTRTGGDPVFFGKQFGNMNTVTLEKEYSDEITEVYVGGAGNDVSRVIGRAGSSTTIVDHPYIWNRRETLVNSAGSGVVATLNNEASGYLQSYVPTKKLLGDIVSTPSSMYGKHWNWGDKVTAICRNEEFDAHINSITVNWSRDTGETITASLKAGTTL
jgi:hypothetical protein